MNGDLEQPMFSIVIPTYNWARLLGLILECIYSIDLYFGDYHSSIDWIWDAISFWVMSSDVLGTGKLPPRHCGAFFWPAKWRLEVESCSTEEAAVV